MTFNKSAAEYTAQNNRTETTEIWPTRVYDLPQLLVFMTETGCVLCGAPTEAKETVERRSPRKTDSECRVLTVQKQRF